MYSKRILAGLCAIVCLSAVMAVSAGCRAGSNDTRAFAWQSLSFPVYPDSRITVDNSMMKVFQSTDEAAKVVDFYTRFCEESGIKIAAIPEGTADFDVRITADAENLILSIKKHEGKTNVVISGKEMNDIQKVKGREGA